MRLRLRSAPAEWARSIARATPSSAATSRSRVLPEAFAADPDRVARFSAKRRCSRRSIIPTSRTIYGLEESDGVRALVMELVEGETCRSALRAAPIPSRTRCTIARQIAEALEAAHEQGIVHRDLKPANVKVARRQREGARLRPREGDGGYRPAAPDLTHSPTLSMMATQAGVILGTAAYMSPEQAKGFPADQRSDVFSFGSVLYEMLTGRQPFQGDTAPDVLASVLVREPDLDLLPPNLNPRMPELLRRCLEKNPKNRWQAVGDLRAEIEAIAAAPRVAPAIQPIVARQTPVEARGLDRCQALFGPLSSVLRCISDRPRHCCLPSPAFRWHSGRANSSRMPAARRLRFHRTARRSPTRRTLACTSVMSELDAQPIRGTEATQCHRVESHLFAGWSTHRVLVWSRSDVQADFRHGRRGGDHLFGDYSVRHDLGHARDRVRSGGGDHAGLPQRRPAGTARRRDR